MIASGVSVCTRCYSDRALRSYRANSVQRYQRNAESLRHEYPMPSTYIPWINSNVVRLFSHGDVEDAVMAGNILRIVDAYPNTLFVGWTKNAAAWREALSKYRDSVDNVVRHGKPHNLRLIFSNASLDRIMNEPPSGFDMVFNVTRDPDEPTNCHGKCKDCMTCYTATPHTNCIIEAVK
jgi:hypothetical protein